MKVIIRQSSGLGLLGTLCLLNLTVGCSPSAPPEVEVRRPVKTMVVAEGGDLRVRSFPGKVEASRQAELAFQVPGLVNFPVREGQQIAEGDLIGELRQDEFRARLQSLQGRLDQARAALQAQLAGERPEERRRREALVRAAEATLANARAELDRSTQMFSRRARTVCGLCVRVYQG